VVLAALVIAVVVCIVSPRWRRKVPRIVGLVVGGIVAIYLVGRGIAEFWTIDFANPVSYEQDWGGPSLIGVLAVHSGPGLIIVVATIVWFLRRRSRKKAGTDSPLDDQTPDSGNSINGRAGALNVSSDSVDDL
jgi:hypothetical protein